MPAGRSFGEDLLILFHSFFARPVMPLFAARQAQTTVPCPQCEKPMTIERSCHQVYMRCKECGKTYPIEQYIPKADKAMEDFLDNCYVDRI